MRAGVAEVKTCVHVSGMLHSMLYCIHMQSFAKLQKTDSMYSVTPIDVRVGGS